MLERKLCQQAGHLLFSQVTWTGATWCSTATVKNTEIIKCSNNDHV